MRKSGFTLIEILVVIVIISVLATLVTSGASYTMKVSRSKRAVMSAKVLETAVNRYYTEYGEWPGGYNGKEKTMVFGEKGVYVSNSGCVDPKNRNKKHSAYCKVHDRNESFNRECRESCDVLFGMLRVESDANKNKINFFDETAFYTESKGKEVGKEDKGETVKLSDVSGDRAILYVPRSGKQHDGHFPFYTVVINYEYNTCAVGCGEVEDE